MNFIRGLGWLIGGVVATVGFLFLMLSRGDAGIDSATFLFGFIWVTVGLLFVLFAEIMHSQLMGSATR